MSTNRLRALLCTVLLATAASVITTMPAQAAAPQGSTHLSNASQWLANGSATIVSGSVMTVAGLGAGVIASVETVGDVSVIVLTSAVDGSRASVRLSGQAARQASTLAGASVEVLALASGMVLVTAGQVLAFIPNELGRALLHSSRVDQRG